MGRGVDSYVGAAKETTFKTPVSPPTDFFAFRSVGLDGEYEVIESQEIRTTWDEPQSYQGPQRAGGPLVVEIHPNPFGILLRSMFGNPVTDQPDAVGAPTAYRHIWSAASGGFSADSDLFPYTIYVNKSPQIFQYPGGVVNVARVAFGNSERILTASLDLLAAKENKVAGPFTPSYDAQPAFRWGQVKFRKPAATDLADLLDFTLTIDNRCEAQFLPFSTTPNEVGRIVRGAFRMVRVEGTMYFSTIAEYDKFTAWTEEKVEIEATGANIGAAVNYRLFVELFKVKYLTFGKPIESPNFITARFTAKAEYSPTDATSIKVTLVNTKTAY